MSAMHSAPDIFRLCPSILYSADPPGFRRPIEMGSRNGNRHIGSAPLSQPPSAVVRMDYDQPVAGSMPHENQYRPYPHHAHRKPAAAEAADGPDPRPRTGRDGR